MIENTAPSQGHNKMFTWLIVLVVLVVVGGVAYKLMCNNDTTTEGVDNQAGALQDQPVNNQDNMSADNGTQNNDQATTSPATGDQSAADNSAQAPAANIKSFTFKAGNYYFEPKEIKVKQGDTVQITLKNVEGMHDWIIDEFNANTGRLTEGQSKTISFVADKTGTFEYYCSVGKHRLMGMKGNLIVE